MTVINRTYDRETAVEAAKVVFWEKGYHLTSLKDLESAMAMKPGSIYAAFSSKEALFHLALARYFLHDCGEIIEYLNKPESPLDGLTAYLRDIARSDRHAPCSLCMLVKTLASETSSDTPNAKVAQNYLDQIQTAFAGFFEKAQNAGEVDRALDTFRLALRYQSCVTALKFELHRETPRADIILLAEDMAGLFEALRLT